MGCPQPICLPDLGRIVSSHIVTHPLPAVSRLRGLHLVLPEEAPSLLVRVQPVPEEDALPGHEHHPPVVVLQARASAAGVLDAVQDLDRRPGLDRLGGSVLELLGGEVADLGEQLRVELAREADLPDLVVVGERPHLPGLPHARHVAPLAPRALSLAAEAVRDLRGSFGLAENSPTTSSAALRLSATAARRLLPAFVPPASPECAPLA